MIRLQRPPNPDLKDCWDDVVRIRESLARAGFAASDDDIAWAWAEYSENNWCATWFSLDAIDNDTEIVAAILTVLVPQK